MANCCALCKIRHSSRTTDASCTNGLDEVQKKTLGTHLKKFLYDTLENWSIQV